MGEKTSYLHLFFVRFVASRLNQTQFTDGVGCPEDHEQRYEHKHLATILTFKHPSL